MSWLYTIPAGFLAGTIPFGLLIARAKGIDIRKVGSGNIGATNVGRVLGKRYFLLCFALDFLKGFGPVLAAGWLAGVLGKRDVPVIDEWLWMAAMLAPVLGHVLNPWLKFKGGKGVATSLGALLAVFPHLTVPAAGAFAVFAVVLAGLRYMSVAAMSGAVSLPFFVVVAWWLGQSGTAADPAAAGLESLAPVLTLSVLVAVLVLWTHRGNIRRLRAGTEPKIHERVATK
jgi:glycerol-3-phosphate acyltransferase PlsY